MPIPARTMTARTLLTAIAGVALLTPAAAQSTFHVKEFDYERGNWVVETINAYQGGFRPRSDRVQWGHELGIGYAVSDWWQPKLLVSFDKEESQPYHVQRLLLENTFTLKPLVEKRDGIGFAWFQSLEFGLDDQQTNATLFGPMITAQLGRFSLSTNTFLDKTFGRNREEGMGLLLAWQGRYEIADKIKIGMEGYTYVPEIGAGSRTPQTGTANRIGPMVIFEVDLPGLARPPSPTGPAARLRHATDGGKHEPPHAEIEIGALFGTTAYTPDTTIKANMHVRF
jgi:hypothetical protein